MSPFHSYIPHPCRLKLDVLIPRLRIYPTDFGFDAVQKRCHDVEKIDRLQYGVKAERTALVVLHIVSRGRILGRGHAADGVRLDGVSYQEEYGNEGQFAAEDEGGKAVAQVVQGKVFSSVQMARGVEEREYQGLKDVEYDYNFEADELLKSAAGLEN